VRGRQRKRKNSNGTKWDTEETNVTKKKLAGKVSRNTNGSNPISKASCEGDLGTEVQKKRSQRRSKVGVHNTSGRKRRKEKIW